MSFRTAYSDFKSGRKVTRSQGLHRDPTPEEQKKIMDRYYIKQQQKKNGR